MMRLRAAGRARALRRALARAVREVAAVSLGRTVARVKPSMLEANLGLKGGELDAFCQAMCNPDLYKEQLAGQDTEASEYMKHHPVVQCRVAQSESEKPVRSSSQG